MKYEPWLSSAPGRSDLAKTLSRSVKSHLMLHLQLLCHRDSKQGVILYLCDLLDQQFSSSEGISRYRVGYSQNHEMKVSPYHKDSIKGHKLKTRC